MIGDEHIPAPQSDVAKAVFDVLVGLVAPNTLSFGGGTVLAARWRHRKSFDVDLFCDPTEYGLLSRRDRVLIEEGLARIVGCSPKRTWCEDIATYTEIDGIGATVLPRSVVLEPAETTRLAGTALRLQGNAQILYGKIVGRMYGAGEITVRDAYDVAAAHIHDPAALVRACDHASPRVLSTVAEVIEMLPRGWSGNEMQALIDPRHRWSEDELRGRVLVGLRGEPLAHEVGGGPEL